VKKIENDVKIDNVCFIDESLFNIDKKSSILIKRDLILTQNRSIYVVKKIVQQIAEQCLRIYLPNKDDTLQRQP
jgi:hypothetical protein